MPARGAIANLVLVKDTGFLTHPEDAHPHAELVYAVRGRYRSRTRDGSLTLSPWQAVYYPPGWWHRPHARRGDGPLLYCLQWYWRSRVAPPPAATVLDDANGRLLQALDWLWNLHTTSSPRRAQRAALLEVVLLEVLDARRSVDRQPADPLTRVHRYIHENLFSYWSMRDLVAVAEMSESRLRRRFGARYGMPPVRLSNELRRQRAVALIRGTRLPLGEIARRCRYSSTAHLSRVVKAGTGSCPRDLRGAAADATR